MARLCERLDRRAGWLATATWAALLVVGGCADESEPTNDDPATETDDDSPVTGRDDDDGDDGDDEQGEKDAGAAIDAGGGKRDTGVPAIKDAQASREGGASARDGSVAEGGAQPDDEGSDGGNTDGGASGSDAGGEPRMDLGEDDGKDVITIGDSWMRLILTGIETGLVKASGNRPYRTYGVPGTRLLDGVIPRQYTSAKSEDPDIKTVVMTAGGNDVIQNAEIERDCAEGGELCEEQVAKIREALADLWAEMSADGVQDVIHVMYSKAAGSGVKNRDAHGKQLADTCAAVAPPLRCHLLDTDELIKAQDMRSDGIHPNDAGYDKIGKAVYDLMVAEGMRR